MPRSDEAEHFINAVYEAVQEIPHGKITSYAHIAKLLGYPKRPRQVGMALKHLPKYSTHEDREDGEGGELALPHFHERNVPWQRVLNSKGGISHRGPGSAERHAIRLRRENVEVTRDAMGEFWVNMGQYGWFPDMLPSEKHLYAAESESESESEGRS